MCGHDQEVVLAKLFPRRWEHEIIQRLLVCSVPFTGTFKKSNRLPDRSMTCHFTILQSCDAKLGCSYTAMETCFIKLPMQWSWAKLKFTQNLEVSSYWFCRELVISAQCVAQFPLTRTQSRRWTWQILTTEEEKQFLWINHESYSGIMSVKGLQWTRWWHTHF